jgi:iron complex outermembrane recepter protein
MIGPNLSEWAVRRRSLVVYFMLAALLAGGLSFFGLGRNEDPAFTFRTMVVQAAWPGATLDDTVLQVTERIERRLQDVPGLDYLTSYTRPGFGQAAARAEFSDRVKLCRETPLNQGEANERARCSDHITGDLGAQPQTNPNHPDYFADFMARELSLAPGGNALRLGNTDLVAMESINYDMSLSWYGDGGRFAEVAIFYKDIENYVTDVRGLSIARSALPQNVRDALDVIDSTNASQSHRTDFNRDVFKIDEDFVFHNVNTAINGDKAYVYGMELSYSHFFDSGFFLTSNLTLLNSRADAGESVRAEKTRMPNQADVTSNLTLGWENDMFSARLIGNYRSKILTQIGTCSQADIDRDAEWARLNDASNPDALPGAVGDGTIHSEYCQRWSDVFHDATVNLDIKLTYNLNPDIKFYFDVMNVTEDVDVFYYRGNQHSGGNVVYRSEGLGRTYQAGVNVRFW